MMSAPLQFGETIQRYEVLGSTQDAARQFAASGSPPGTVVVAWLQTHGRGRRGRTWHAPPGANVCLTAIGASVPAAAAWQLALVAGLAVCEAVRKIAPSLDARVRFPNDVTVNGRKLCGVLIETLPASAPSAVIPLIGVGINVRAAPLPARLAARAVSLEQATDGVCRDIAVVEAAVLRQLSLCWDEWALCGFEATLVRWKALADPAAARAFRLDPDGPPVVCRVCDLRPDGTLVLETPQGGVHELPGTSVVLGED